MGCVWDDWKELAEANGISRELFERRIWNDRTYPRWSKYDAATTQKNKRRRVFIPWLKLAEENGIKRKTYYTRVYDYGWTEENAATIPVRKAKGTSI